MLEKETNAEAERKYCRAACLPVLINRPLMRFNQTPVNTSDQNCSFATDVNTPFNKYDAMFYSRDINANVMTSQIPY